MPPKRQPKFNARGTVKPMKAFRRPTRTTKPIQKSNLFSVDSIFSEDDDDVKEEEEEEQGRPSVRRRSQRKRRAPCTTTVSSTSGQSTVQVSPLTEGEREEDISDPLLHQLSSIRPTATDVPSYASDVAARPSLRFCGFEEVSSWESSTVVSASSSSCSQRSSRPPDAHEAAQLMEQRSKLREEMRALNERIVAIRQVNLPDAQRRPRMDVVQQPISTVQLANPILNTSDFSTFIATPRPSTREENTAAVFYIAPANNEEEEEEKKKGRTDDERNENIPPPFHVQAAREILDLIEQATTGSAPAVVYPGNIQTHEQRSPASQSASRPLRQLNISRPPSPAHDDVIPSAPSSQRARSPRSGASQQNGEKADADIRSESETNFRALIRHLKTDSIGSQVSSINGSQSTTAAPPHRGDNVITITMSPLQSPFFSSLSAAGHSPGPPRITLVKRARTFWPGEGEEDIF